MGGGFVRPGVPTGQRIQQGGFPDRTLPHQHQFGFVKFLSFFREATQVGKELFHAGVVGGLEGRVEGIAGKGKFLKGGEIFETVRKGRQLITGKGKFLEGGEILETVRKG